MACKLFEKVVYLRMKYDNFYKKIGVVQAPLAGISNIAFRLICRQFGAGLVFTEMISADGIKQRNARTLRYLLYEPQEHPIAIQIFGNDPQVMADAVKIISPLRPDFIDLNMGCPARKVVKRDSGAALLKNLTLSGELVEAMLNATDIPITAKIRTGWGLDSPVAVELSQLLEEKGVAAITVHPRTQQQQFKGEADWDVIRQVKAAVKIPVIGNGDIDSAQAAKRMLDTTGCDTVMIGRAAMGYPWIFNEIRTFLEDGKILPPPSHSEKLEICLQHFKLAVYETNANTVESMRKHVSYYTHGMPQSAQFRAELFKLRHADLVEKRIREYHYKIKMLEEKGLAADVSASPEAAIKDYSDNILVV